jgi:hypothetical protein
MWKAACAVVLLIAATSIEIGCGETYRPIAVPSPVVTGNPSGVESEVVLNQCPTGQTCTDGGGAITEIDVSGDTNAGNKLLLNAPTSITFDNNRSTVYTTNTSTDSLTQVLLAASTAGFAANTTTISLEKGSAPIGMSFEYYGTTYTTDYVVNSGTATTTCPGTGSISPITQASAEVTANVCVGVNPVFAWIYKDQSKVFVLDKTENQAYVVSASKLKWTNKIPVGTAPIKATQSADGLYIYVLNSGGSISIIDGQAETSTTVPTANALSSALPIDMVLTPPPTDTSTNTQVNNLWILQADGTVSVYDTTVPGALTWITSLATGANPTNLALMRNGAQAYVGLGGTDKIIAIDTTKLASLGITTGATTPITVGIHRSIAPTAYTDSTGATLMLSETTTPTVNYVAVSRGVNTSNTYKAYAATTTSTTYNYFDASGNPTPLATASIAAGCSAVTTSTNSMSCPNLYNGTSIVTAVGDGTTPINTYVTTIPAPSVVTYCDPNTGQPDGQKNCPTMVPAMILGRS